MTQAEIDSKKFVELLLAEFPELRDEAQEWQGLIHLQMMEFALFTDRACKRGDWKTADRCLRLADRLLRSGGLWGQQRNLRFISRVPSAQGRNSRPT